MNYYRKLERLEELSKEEITEVIEENFINNIKYIGQSNKSKVDSYKQIMLATDVSHPFFNVAFIGKFSSKNIINNIKKF